MSSGKRKRAEEKEEVKNKVKPNISTYHLYGYSRLSSYQMQSNPLKNLVVLFLFWPSLILKYILSVVTAFP